RHRARRRGQHSQAAAWGRGSPSQSWRTFLANHVLHIVAADFFVVPTATCRLLFVLVILGHERRRIVHVAVTDRPTAAGAAQQLREAFPWNEAPHYLVHDRDAAFSAWATTAAAIGIEEVLTAPRSPWQNPYAERLIGSIAANASITSSSSTNADFAAPWRRTSSTCDQQETPHSSKSRNQSAR